MANLFDALSHLFAVMVPQNCAEQAAGIRQIDDDDVERVWHFVAEQDRLDARPNFAFCPAVNHRISAGLEPP